MKRKTESIVLTHFYILIPMILFLTLPAAGQDLFEQAVNESKESSSPLSFELNGFVRGVLFSGKVPDHHTGEVKSVYGESALRLRIRKGAIGDGYTEFRLRRGTEFGEVVSEINLREAYINVYTGSFDFRVGHQIVVWGRADGYNPTNNLTPQNMLIRSPDEDDKREGNFLLRTNWTISPIRLEGMWVPVYAASVLPTQLIPLPPGVELDEMEMPAPEFCNGAFALKLHLELPSFDGSVSLFSGGSPWPGITGSFDTFPVRVRPKSYRITVIGGDFSTTWGSWGFRGECAYRKPEETKPEDFHIPNSEFQWVLGIDKSWGDFSCIVQYIGKKVESFSPLTKPAGFDPLYEITHKNRLIASQLYELSHSISFRPALSLFHETMTLEIAGMVNTTTEELLLRPKWTTDLTDAFTLIVGAEWYSGPDETFFGMVDESLSSVFLELKASF